MTFVVGLQCKDGIILCADQMESDGVTKRYRSKISAMTMNDDWGVCWATAAFGDLCDKFSDKFKSSLKRLEEFKQEDIEHACEACLALMHQDNPNQLLQVMVGVWCAPILATSNMRVARTILYRGRSDLQCLAVETDYAICGDGDVTLAEFILRNTFRYRSISVDEGTRLGIFVTAMMKEYAGSVGGPTDVVTHRRAEKNWFGPLPEEIKAVESTFNIHEFESAMAEWFRKKLPNAGQ
jgi:hypothetical protein